MNIRIILFTTLIIYSAACSSQRLTAVNDVIECGSVLYEQPVTARFELTNSGGSLTVTDVHSGCGCTTVDYPKTPIRDGGKFVISATYDARQLGHFSRDIAVYTDASDKPLYLTMRGVVVEEIVGFAGTYPFTLDGILTDKNDIEFDDVVRGDYPIQKINIKNDCEFPVSPVVMHLPKWLKANIAPTTIHPGRQGVVTLVLDSRMLRDYGLTSTSVFLGAYPGDKVSLEKEITVSAVLLPSFIDMTAEQYARAPQITLSAGSDDKYAGDTLHLGHLSGKSKKSGTIIIGNNGQSELEISSLQMFTDVLSVKLNKTHLRPGEQAKLKVTAYANRLSRARSQPRVLMITNDPQNPKVVIKINIEE